MKLWEIDKAIDEIMDTLVDEETGEIDDSAVERLEALDIARQDKLKNIGLAYKNFFRFAEEIKAEKLALEKRQKQAEKKAEWLKAYMQRSLDGDPFKTPEVAVSYRRSSFVQVYDIGALPQEYLRYKAPEPDKTKIKEALKDGQTVPGALMMDNVSMTIK